MLLPATAQDHNLGADTQEAYPGHLCPLLLPFSLLPRKGENLVLPVPALGAIIAQVAGLLQDSMLLGPIYVLAKSGCRVMDVGLLLPANS